MIKRYYSPFRVFRVFMVVLTVFLIMRRRKSFLFIKPLKAERLRAYINILGASFIKLAQVLATRADFFPKEYINELRQLHDDIPPMSDKDFKRLYDRAFGDSDYFSCFEEKPIASASIGQVHRAALNDGRIVAVKLRRYNIEKQVRADIRILTIIRRILKPLFSEYTKNSIEAVISEFSRMILKEVDMTVELSNLEKFSEMYDMSGVRFPRGYREFSSVDALVMSFEEGFRFDDNAALQRLDISFEDLMGKLIRFYTEQILVNGYFHADPHPGNLLVNIRGELILLDFGMVQRISSRTRTSIIELVKSANEQDFETYIRSAKKLGIIAVSADDNQLYELAETMFDIFNNEKLDAKTMQQLAFEVLDTVKDMPFKLPQEVIYIMRVSSIIEGLGTNYLENFNGIKDILPILKDNIPRALGAESKMLEMAYSEARELPFTFKKVKKIIDDLSGYTLEVKISEESIQAQKETFKRYSKPLITGLMLIVTAFFIQGFDYEYCEEASMVVFGLGIIKLFFAK